jgi:hypothetical protein
MNTWPRIVLAFTLLVLSAASARADLIPPGGRDGRFPRPVPVPIPGNVGPLVIEANDNVDEARLLVPRKLLVRRQAALDGDGDKMDALVEVEGDKPETAAADPLRFRTIIAGSALALALACGGLWFVRFRGRSGKAALPMLLATAALLGAGGAAVWGDVPPIRRPPQPPPFVQPPIAMPAGTRVRVVIVDQGDAVRLIVNRKVLAKAAEPPAPAGVRFQPGR